MKTIQPWCSESVSYRGFEIKTELCFGREFWVVFDSNGYEVFSISTEEVDAVKKAKSRLDSYIKEGLIF